WVRIAVVTGGKRGIGFEICKQLVSSTRDLLVVITAKDEEKGLQSLDKLKTLGLSENVAVRQLDVKNPDSIASFADFIKTKFGKLDILFPHRFAPVAIDPQHDEPPLFCLLWLLNEPPSALADLVFVAPKYVEKLVNNAGVNGIIVHEENLNVKPNEATGVKAYMTKQIMLQTYETAKDCIETNYYGTKHVTEALLPFLHLSPSPRIVNISTGISKLENIKDENMKKVLSNVDGLTEEVLDEVVNGFLRDAKDNLLEEKGWDEPFSAYIVSKTVINAYTRVLAKKYPSFRINTVNPGFTKTVMTHFQGIYTPDEAARGPVRLALMPDEGPSGHFQKRMVAEDGPDLSIHERERECARGLVGAGLSGVRYGGGLAVKKIEREREREREREKRRAEYKFYTFGPGNFVVGHRMKLAGVVGGGHSGDVVKLVGFGGVRMVTGSGIAVAVLKVVDGGGMFGGGWRYEDGGSMVADLGGGWSRVVYGAKVEADCGSWKRDGGEVYLELLETYLGSLIFPNLSMLVPVRLLILVCYCRIAVVTGGNKGIGFEICKQLASSSHDVIVVVTARDEQKGLQALHKLKTLGLSENALVFQQLDVTDPASITSLADFIGAQFGKLDILVNNAGITGIVVDEGSVTSLKLQPGEDTGVKTYMAKQVMLQTYETAKDCIQTNYYGTKHVTEALLPFLCLSASPRIVNVSSGVGKLEKVKDERAKQMLSDVDRLTEEVVEDVVNGYLCDAKDGSLEEKGWDAPLSAYIVSKAVVNAYTRILANKYPSFRINAANPGFTKTDMTHHKGTYTVEEGARCPVWLALMPDEGPSGRFFFQMEETTF
ncbi:LOW QUALITY PROTEIN: hypothetical protein M8C21_030969, partial [Ambrosia artemisiifolia]